MTPLPRLYAILDSSHFLDIDALCLSASELVAGGVTLVQYRNKSGNTRQMLEQRVGGGPVAGPSRRELKGTRRRACAIGYAR